MSRRDFLRIVGSALGVGAAGHLIEKTELIHKITGSVEKRVKVKQEEDFNEEIYYDGKEPDIEAIRNIFDFNTQKRIEINLETVKQLKDYWKYIYTGDMKSDLVGAMEGIKDFIPELKAVFNKYNVPEKYALLAIPESHWKLDAVSRAGAEGPYQFMPETGKEYGLMNSKDRQNPLKSAEACARFLKKLYERTQDWDLALSGYNGGFLGKYLKKCQYNSHLMHDF